MNRYYDKEYFAKRDLLPPHLADLVKNLVRQHNLKKTLDIGCGTGRLVAFLNQNNLAAFGIDNSQEAVKKANQINKSGSITKASATSLPFANSTFDLVTAISLIEHLSQKQAQQFLSETKRVLKPKGIIFLVTPNFATPIRWLQDKNWFAYADPTHINFYTPSTLSTLVKKYGFKNIQLQFKFKYRQSFDWEFPPPFANLPKVLKKLSIYLLFSTPLSIIRNSFWLVAQKGDA